MTDTVNLFFNGKELSFLKNGRALKSWPAMSGREGYQHKLLTPLKSEGPIPEGIWYVRQKNYQNMDDLPFLERNISKIMPRIPGIKIGKWTGGIPAWARNVFGWSRHPIPKHLAEKIFQSMGGGNLVPQDVLIWLEGCLISQIFLKSITMTSI